MTLEQTNRQEKKIVFAILALFFGLGLFIIFHFDGTNDGGDTISHFLFAKYAFKHPENFFNHWAKPVFVLLAAPFAQLGFAGVKFFNLCVATTTLYLTYLTAKALGMKMPWLAALFLGVTIEYMIQIFSGLTEPLFALFLIAGVYLLIREKWLSACLILSFLPLVRTEGLFILAVITPYLLIKKQWKFLPVLLVGHIVYGIAGYPYHHTVFWPYTHIPYAPTVSGTTNDPMFYVQNMYWVNGIVLNFFWKIGFIAIAWKLIQWKKQEKLLEEIFLVYGPFLALFVAHSYIYWKGMYGSVGLVRVVLAVAPMFTLHSLNGFNLITDLHFLPEKIRNAWKGILIAIIAIYPFSGHEAAVHWEFKYNLYPDQVVVNKAAEYIKQHYPGFYVYYAHQHICLPLNLDHFDRKVCESQLPVLFSEPMKPHSIVVWDDFMAGVCQHVTQEMLEKDIRLRKVATFGDRAGKAKVIIFEKIGPS